MKLCLKETRYYRVKRGQTLYEIAENFLVPPRVLAAENNLTQEVEEGMVLSIPRGGNLYLVRGGESMSLLCGSKEQFEQKNHTSFLYPTQIVLL